jgi:hypothetical protein
MDYSKLLFHVANRDQETSNMKAMIATTDPAIRRPNPFARACFAQAMARVHHADAEQFLTKDEGVALRIVQRANVSPGSTTTSGWGAELQRDAFRNFLIELSPYSGAARLIALAIQAATKPVDETNYPVRANGPTVPAWVGELDAIPVHSDTFSLVSIGPAKKMGHIISWSRELGKRSDAERIFDRMLREDVSAGLDSAFFATSAGSSTAPAGLLNGVSAISPTGNSGEDGIRSDLGQLAESVATGGSGNVTFVMAPEKLARLRIQAPTVAANTDIAPSAAVPTDRVIAVDPLSLLVAVDEAPEIMKAEEATLHMSNIPLEIVSDTGPTTADPVRSLWQTASAALRVIHELDFVKRRTGAVAFSDGVAWW